MQKNAKYAQNMRKYARNIIQICIHMQVSAGQLMGWNMQKYANYVQGTCKNMQNMQSWFAYAKYAKICTTHFADEVLQFSNCLGNTYANIMPFNIIYANTHDLYAQIMQNQAFYDKFVLSYLWILCNFVQYLCQCLCCKNLNTNLVHSMQKLMCMCINCINTF